MRCHVVLGPAALWAALSLTAPAGAAPVLGAATWDFSVCNGSTVLAGTAAGNQAGAGAVGNSYTCAANGSTTRDLSVSAWGAVSSTNNVYGTAYLASKGNRGFGVSAQSEGGAAGFSPNDALDNDPSSLAPNLLLLRFNTAVILDQLTLGWSMYDADLTVMAYTGAGSPTSFIAGKTAGNLTDGGALAGWRLVQNLGDAAPDLAHPASDADIVYDLNAGGVSATYWLVAAYHADFGGGALDSLVDYSSLLSVRSRDAQGLPEPPTLGLVAGALLAIGWRRRPGAQPARCRYHRALA